jgi:hypothetical protein
MKEIVLDTVLDGLKLLPFLLITFLIIEFLEHKMSDKTEKIISKSGKFGPIIGSTLGIFPQCGFSVAATNLYVTRVIHIGTLIAIYLSTSDELLPILLSHKIDGSIIFKFLFIKWIVGILFGIIIDFLFRKRKVETSYELCDHDHCHCEKENIFLSAIKHTMNTFLFILITTFFINILFEYLKEDYLSVLFLKDSILASFLTSFIGLIPTCGASIMLSELYIEGVISFASCVAGLLTSSGVALLVLFKTNKNIKENIFILVSIYSIGAITGILLEVLGIIL